MHKLVMLGESSTGIPHMPVDCVCTDNQARDTVLRLVQVCAD